MFKNVIKEIQQKPLGYLTAVCARPGDGRRTFSIELANDLAMQGFTVCYCSITRTEKYLENKLLPIVRILNDSPQNAWYALTRLTLSSKAGSVVVLIDDLSAFVLQKGLKYAPTGTYDKAKIQTELIQKFRKLAIQQKLRIVVADTLAHASNTDDMLPISSEALKLCDRAYILYKDSITADTFYNADSTMLKLKEIEL